MKRLFFLLFIQLCTLLIAEPTTLVIFGATGDLCSKKIFPAVYNLKSEDLSVIGIGRRPLEQSDFHEMVASSLKKNSRIKPENFDFIPNQFSYFQAHFENMVDYQGLKEKIGDRENVIYFLATEPKYFTTIIQNLKKAGLVEKQVVIIEKPFGYDLASAETLYADISQNLKKEQIYLIDHYLGKVGVMNLLPLRFDNPELNEIWNAAHIDNVQINLAEKIGIGTRGAFWEGTGLLRDVVQNHVMQMLAMLAMEQPVGSNIHDEKVKVLKAIAELQPEDIIRGQYQPGIIDGETVKGYLEENGVASDSNVETFMAARLFINNDRWSGVPFYIRAGKRLSKQATEIVITFKEGSKLYISIQPDRIVSFEGANAVNINPLEDCVMEAYECLIQGAIAHDNTYFADIEEILASWRLFTPILGQGQLDHYDAGSFGPQSANQLLEQDGRVWHK